MRVSKLNSNISDQFIYGITIRKVSISNNNETQCVSKNNLKKQILTLYKKIYKDNQNVYFEYTIEKNLSLGYHAHIICYNLCLKELKYYIGKFICNDHWTIQESIYYDLHISYSKYGECVIHSVYDLVGFKRYIAKYSIPIWLTPL